MTVDRFCFDVELLFIARKHGLKIVQIPVHWENPENSKARVLFDAPKMFFDLLVIRINNFKGKYD